MDRPRRGPCPDVARARAHADRGSDSLRLLARTRVVRPRLRPEGHRGSGESPARNSPHLRPRHERFLSRDGDPAAFPTEPQRRFFGAGTPSSAASTSLRRSTSPRMPATASLNRKASASLTIAYARVDVSTGG